jgi:L-seryl-tRNA(Ser) seleniumtransferase
MNRRRLLKMLGLAPMAGTVATGEAFASPGGSPLAKGGRDYFKELGVRTFINAAGTYTSMTATLMRPSTMEAIRYASDKFCLLDDVQDKVGERIAEITHAESAVVTSGAFAALSLGMAGILTGKDPERVKRLPRLEGSGMKTEVICQKGHAIGYNQAMRNVGVKIVMIETMAELEAAIGPQTAAMFFLHINADRGQINHEQWVAVAKKHGIPTMIDIAADVPPVSNLWRFNDMGFDLVAISGGKALRGPQSAGILMGRKHLIEAARLSMPPRGETIGRGMKVNKEEILGMYVALEEFVKIDHDKEYALFQKRIDRIKASADQVAGVKTVVRHPTLGNVTPTLDITWDPARINGDGNTLREALRKGSPSIEVVGGRDNLSITAWSLREGEDAVVAKRVREVLEQASVKA